MIKARTLLIYWLAPNLMAVYFDGAKALAYQHTSWSLVANQSQRTSRRNIEISSPHYVLVCSSSCTPESTWLHLLLRMGWLLNSLKRVWSGEAPQIFWVSSFTEWLNCTYALSRSNINYQHAIGYNKGYRYRESDQTSGTGVRMVLSIQLSIFLSVLEAVVLL